MDLTSESTSLGTILDLSRLVCSSLELEVVFERIVAAVRDLSGADMLTLMLVDEQGEYLRLVAAYGLPSEQLGRPVFRLGEGIAGWVARNGTPVHTAALGSDARFVPIYMSAQATLFALPLQVRDRTLGVLNLAKANGGRLFSPATVQMVEIFASYAAIAIDNAAAATSLRYAAAREQVAGLINQAPREPGAATRVSGQLLTTLAALLELTAVTVYLPDGQGAFRPLAGFPTSPDGGASWRPEQPEADLLERRDEGGCELQARLSTPDERHGWLVIKARQQGHYWRRDERELARFAADQITMLLANERLVLNEQQSRALSQTLSQLAGACNAMVGNETLLDFILEQLARYIAYDSSAVFQFHDDHYAQMIAGRGFREARKGMVLYVGPGSVSWEVRQGWHAVYLPDVQQVESWQAAADGDMIRAWIGVPLIVNDAAIGMLTIDKWLPDSFSAGEVQVAQLFADHVAVAFNNQLLLRDARTRASQLQLLHQLSLRMSAYRDADTLLDQVARQLFDTFGYYHVCIYTREKSGLVVRAAYGAVDMVEATAILDESGPTYGLVGYAARTGETLLVNSVAHDLRFVPSPRLSHTAAKLVAAIKQEGQVLGVVAIESEQRGAFGQHDLHLLEAIAVQTGLALEHLRRNEELRRTEERLAQSERLRALGELASGVAHDFNNLLASILGHAQLLLAEPLAPRVAEELRVIERAALDGATSVRRLQGFAQTNRALPDMAVDLGEIIAESLAITRPRWRDAPQSRGVEIVVSHKPGAVPPFAGDGPALRDLATNLVLNALDAMPQGGRLLLRTATLAPEHSPLGTRTALLEVSDTGVGMSPETQARVFDPFFTTKGPRGTGMGLTMVYGIVQRHQGQVHLSSEPGRGTTFSIYLPARPAPNATAPAAVAATPLQGPRQVLVVDDDETVRRVLVRQISRLGHVVAEAASGEAALSLLSANHYDLICTDLGMPGMSGWELIARARQLDGELQTVLVTGWGEQIDQETARVRGADAVVAKPFDLLRLRQVLATLAARRSAH